MRATSEIKIGHTNPYSGPASAYGVEGQLYQAFFKALNEAGGINGRKVTFITYDDGYSPPKTVEMVRKLVEEDKVLLCFNTLGTPCNTAIHKYMNQKKVPQLYVATGASKWGDPKNFPWTMGYQPDYHTEGAIYAKHILANVKDAKIGVLMQNDDYGKDYWNGMREGLGKEADRVVKHVTYEVTDPTVDSQIIQLKDSGANVFFNVSTPKFAAQAIRKAGELGWKPAQYLNNVSASVASVLKPAGFENSQGIVTAAYTQGSDRQAMGRRAGHEGVAGLHGEEHAERQHGRRHLRLRLLRRAPDGRDAEALRRRADARQHHEAGGGLPQFPAAAAAAGHHHQHQRDRLLSDPGGPARPLQGRELGPVRRRHARRKQLIGRLLHNEKRPPGIRRPFFGGFSGRCAPAWPAGGAGPGDTRRY